MVTEARIVAHALGGDSKRWMLLSGFGSRSESDRNRMFC